jgi:hypothetical protein
VVLPMLFALALLGPAGSVDIAPPATRVAIAPIDYSEVIPAHTRVAVYAAVDEAVQSTTRNALILDVDDECRTRACALRQARDANAEFLLELRVTVDDRDYTIDIVVIAASDEREVAESTAVCKLCGQAELLAVVSAQVAPLANTLEETSEHADEAPPRRVDDRLDNLDPRVRDTLGHASRPGSGLRTGGWVSFALGLAGVGAGSTLIAVDGREHGPTCAVEIRDVNGGCPNVYTTQTSGIVAVGLGGAAILTGIGLLIAGKTREHRHAAARIQPTPGGIRLRF